MLRQAAALAYVDTIKVMAVLCLLMLSLVLLLKRPKPGAPAMAH